MDPETKESNGFSEESATPQEFKEVPINGANNANGFRVKNVSEINSSVATPTTSTDKSENINKRKFSAPTEEDAKEENDDTLLQLEKSEENSTNDKRDEKKRKMENVNETKTNISTAANTIENSIPTTSTPVAIKVEADETETKIEPETDIARERTQNSAIKKEENDIDASCSTVSNNNSRTNAVSMSVEVTGASSTTRDSCRYGIRCFRQNPTHRQEEAHPGDVDYRRPTYPAPPPGTPNCVFGNRCYRRNPVHFQEFAHPEDTDFEENYKNYRLRQRRQQQLSRINNDDIDSDDEQEDPFLDDYDISDDYVPSEESEYDEDDEFVGDYDDCDRAEE